MTVLGSTSAYASSTSVEFNEERGLYLAQVVSRDGVHIVEGPDRASVEYGIEAVLRDEYNAMIREETLNKSRETGRSRGGGSSGSNNRDSQEETIDGMKVHRHSPGERGPRPKFSSWVDMVTGGLALSQGNLVGAAGSAISLAFGEWFDKVDSIWNKKPKQKIFAVSFGGILITATSKAMLRKLLTRQRNKRIQRIMTSIRKHDDERKNASTVENITSKDTKRIRNKKKRAEILRPRSWEKRVCPQGQQTGLKSRTIDLRTRVKEKRERASGLWAHRV